MWKTVYTRDMKASDALHVTGHHKSKPVKHEQNRLHLLPLVPVCCFILFFVLSACSTTHYAYSSGMFHGKEALKRGDYAGARQSFEAAYQNERTPDALMYLAMVDYRTNNLDNAQRLIGEAEMMGSGNYHYLRVLGYKALILLKKSRDQGLEALDRYVAFYELNDPLVSIEDVREMVRSGNVDLPRLESLIEEQVSWFENDLELYWSTGVGYYDGKNVMGGPFRFRGGAIIR